MSDTIGRIPPHDSDAEIALLGAVLFRNRALEEVQTMIEKNDFYTRSHQIIWDGIISLKNEKPGVTIDLVTLASFLEEKGMLADCGGKAYVASLTNAIPASTNASYYAQIIRNLSLKRQLLELSVQIGNSAFDATSDVKSSIDNLDERLSALATNITTGNYISSGNFMMRVVEDIQEKIAGKKKSGIESGFKYLDKYTGGFKPSDLIIIGARPSVGKTAFALSIAHNMAFHSEPPVKVGFFSLEMSGMTLLERLIARESSVNSMRIRNGKLEKDMEEALMHGVESMYERQDNLLIQDTPNIKLMEIKAQARRMVRDDGVQIIFIDYIGLIDTESVSAKQRHEQVAEISRALKSLARELNVPIIVLSQVSREAGKDRAPMLADLRESGAIEQDADVVILLDDASKRLDENNKIAQYSDTVDSVPDNDTLEHNRPIKVIIAKQRNGSTVAFDMMFKSDFVSFTDIERMR